ncbi:MAG TPA: hypothetical protein VGF56_05115 [Rhizomicrobium sp.]|jgi:hypothetical protein
MRRILVAAAFLLAASPTLAAAPPGCSAKAIPGTPVTGTVGGKHFVVKQATVTIGKGFAVNDVKFDSYDLMLEVDGIFNALTTRVIVKEGTRADGRSFRVVDSESIGDQPMAIAGTPEVQSWDLQLESAGVDTSFTQEAASMRLEYGQRKGNVLPGKIVFCAPGQKATIAGTFNAVIGR